MKRYDLRTARKRAGLSQKDLERASGVDQPTISRYETGKIQDPTFSIVLRLAKPLGIHPEQLIFGAGVVAS